MNIVEDSDSKRLESLAISFAKDVLKRRKWGPLDKVILHGYNEKTLNLIRVKMEIYFRERNTNILVDLDGEGYSIDVGYFMRR